MYRNLCDIGIQNSLTIDKKYPCLSVPNPTSFPPYVPEQPNYYNREYYLPPVQEIQNPSFKPDTSNLLAKTDIVPPLSDANFMGFYNKELYQDKNLLPVLDCRFNLREICKQCILLEDHLSHERKRCHDCCIKHFLALEGLSEEAITLDKESKYNHLVKDMPEKIRQIQKIWFSNPDKNAHRASQMLREIRKMFQQQVFDFAFTDLKNCEGGMCKVK